MFTLFLCVIEWSLHREKNKKQDKIMKLNSLKEAMKCVRITQKIQVKDSKKKDNWKKIMKNTTKLLTWIFLILLSQKSQSLATRWEK